MPKSGRNSLRKRAFQPHSRYSAAGSLSMTMPEPTPYTPRYGGLESNGCGVAPPCPAVRACAFESGPPMPETMPSEAETGLSDKVRMTTLNMPSNPNPPAQGFR